VDVSLGERTYPIVLGCEASDALPRALQDRFGRRPYALVTNTTLEKLYGKQVASWEQDLGFVRCVIDDGEQYKTVATWQKVVDALLGARLDRQAVVVAFGGGVVGDIGGFAAAAFLRGVDYVQVPTTLLAMVDSSVGGKTGVNHPSGKNLIGAFHQPRLVWIDTAYLDTLPRREFVAGYAELFKNAFIGGREMFNFVNGSHDALVGGDRDVLAEGIQRSVRIKAAVVEKDEFESGTRALLNFGHTFAHALERFFGYEGIRHGEAVFWGMACACDLGRRVGTVADGDAAAYDGLLGKLPLPPLPGAADPERVYGAMSSDKKIREGTLRFVLPAAPGESIVRDDVPAEMVMQTLRETLARQPRG
jgi:3-dehydroquinate synthase